MNRRSVLKAAAAGIVAACGVASVEPQSAKWVEHHTYLRRPNFEGGEIIKNRRWHIVWDDDANAFCGVEDYSERRVVGLPIETGNAFRVPVVKLMEIRVSRTPIT